MVQLAEWREAFADIGVQVVGMTYDSRELLARFHDEQQLGYPLLQDENARHVTAYGVLNTEYGPDHPAYGIPHPGILYVDGEGVVRLKFAVPGYRQRPPLDEVHAAIRSIHGGD